MIRTHFLKELSLLNANISILLEMKSFKILHYLGPILVVHDLCPFGRKNLKVIIIVNLQKLNQIYIFKQLLLKAYDANQEMRNSADRTVSITVIRNQNAPIWQIFSDTVSMREDMPLYTPVTNVSAVDLVDGVSTS